MENHIAAQALSLAVSFAVGIVAAFVYDLLRAVRIRWKRISPLTHALDVLYVLAVLFLALWLALVVGEGKLRLYMITGAGVGALLWWIFPSRLLRVAWDFWMDAAVAFARLLLRPLVWCKNFGKKVFSFLRKWFTINRKVEEKEAPAVKKVTRKANPLVLLVIAVLVVVLGVQVLKVYQKVSYAKEEASQLEQQLASQQQENDSLRSDLSKAGDEDFIKRLARELLGLAEEGERIFYDVNE